MIQTGEGSEAEARLVANKVLADLVRIVKKHKNFVPTVEGIQDSVEKLFNPIRKSIMHAAIPQNLATELHNAYRKLSGLFLASA